MNRDHAIEVLLRCRFDEPRMIDPIEREEALKVVSNDSELSAWVVTHIQCQRHFRGAIRGVQPPAGLKEQILMEVRCAVTDSRPTFWKQPRVLFASVAASLVVALAMLLMEPREPALVNKSGMTEFQSRMMSTALRGYAMDLETKDMGRILKHLKDAGAPSNIAVPSKLANGTPLGCASLKWRGKMVSMICFTSGSTDETKNDLWLFVMSQSPEEYSMVGATPRLAKVNRAWAATWADQNHVFMLGLDGSEEALRKWL